MPGNGYNVLKDGSKAASDGFMEKGKFDKPVPSFKEGCDINKDVPRLPQIKGAE